MLKAGEEQEGKGGRACRTAEGRPLALPDEAGMAAGPGAVSTRQGASLLVDGGSASGWG